MSAAPSSAPLRSAGLLRSREVAELLGVDRSTVWRLAERGDLPRVRIGRSVRFRAEAVESLIESCDESLNDERPPVQAGAVTTSAGQGRRCEP